jgi:ubiquitin carboxyl-terminal hydrolase 4/11/15
MADLTNPDAEALQVMAWLEGKDDGVMREGSTPVEGSEWYLLSMSWLDLWKAFVGVGPLTSSDIRQPPRIDNSGLLLKEAYVKTTCGGRDVEVTRLGLRCDVDYVLCPPICWRFLSEKYGVETNSTIIRKSIQITDFETQVEVSLKPVKFAIIPKKGTRPMKMIKPNVIYVSHKETLTDLKLKLLAHVITTFNAKFHESAIRLWKLSDSYTYEFFEEFMRKPENDSYSDITANVIFPGAMLTEELLENCEVADEDLLIVELKDANVSFRFKTQNCAFCNKAIAQSLACSCKRNKYCNESCLTKDKAHHTCFSAGPSSYTTYRSTDAYDRYYSRPTEHKTYQESTSSRRGLTGLQNLGNTCFMNSGLQCLSNTWPLTEFFLRDSYQADLNPTNPLGTRGELAKKFANLVKELWLESSPSFSPWEFKRVLSGFATQFSGYSQHDSQELLSFTLDGLHEDLNRVKVKPYGQEITTTDEMTDEVLADLYWENFTARNQSIIVDNMYGQYRSEVTCPTCYTVSKAFDPFLMLNVSIPNKQYEIVDVVYVSEPVTKLRLMFAHKANVQSLKDKVAEVIGIDPQDVLVGLYSSFALRSFLDDQFLIGGLRGHEGLAVYRRPEAYPLIVDFSKDVGYSSTYSRKVPICLSKILSVDPSISLQGLYLELYKYLCVAVSSELLSQEDLEQAFIQHFPKLIRATGSDLFTVNIVNGHNRYTSYSNYSSGYSTSTYSHSSASYNKACDFCKRRNCDNCQLPLDVSKSLNALLNEKTFECEFKLEVVFSSTAKDVIEVLSRSEVHPSVEEVTLQEQQLKDRPLSIEDCLVHSSQPEQLDAENTIYCKVCKAHVQAQKKMEVYKLPKILIMHMKRFKIQGYYGSKINKTITFPINDFDLSSFVRAPGQGRQVYDLFAVSNHFGSMSFGHYTAFAKNKNTQHWFNFDDSSVSQIRGDVESTIVSGAAYVLFYERRD